MPILLDDLDLNLKTAPTITPKFFSSKLTGSGSGRGLLNDTLRPTPTTSSPTYLTAVQKTSVKRSSTQGETTINKIPLAPVRAGSLYGSTTGAGFTLPLPHRDDRFEAELVGRDKDRWRVFVDMTPQAAVVGEDFSSKPAKRDIVISYRVDTFLIQDPTVSIPDRAPLLDPQDAAWAATLTSSVLTTFEVDPLNEAAGMLSNQLASLGLGVANLDAFDQWLANYPIHERITRLAQTWSSDEIADVVCNYIQGIPDKSDDRALSLLCLQLRYLENYVVPLSAYQRIHATLEATFDPETATNLAKQNLNLLVNHTLSDLQTQKPSLIAPPQPATAPALRPDLSGQQLDAVTTHEPLVMTQSGAGCGKTSVIMERISYLAACGVPAKDITVLSFTNAAADNVKKRNPDVGSMTIASMIHDIYSLNHTSHELSSTETLINSLDIFYPNNDFAKMMRHFLVSNEKKDVGATTALNTFVENNREKVLEVLDTVRQTTLELEIILCYQAIETMIEPPHVQCRYLIIDEVQDNSIFEFIYLLKYVAKHSLSLFIVGDASQTLYEFRSANPRALTTLEGSGVFATYKLSTNYRSNQEILDFANVVLGGLETNQIAGIQLQANSLAVPTADSFNEKVQVRYDRLGKLDGYIDDTLPAILKNTIIPDYVQGCLDRGEQVAFLAARRREVTMIQETLVKYYPDRHVASLVSERPFASDVFSKYIRNYWNDVRQVPPHNAHYVVTQGIANRADKLVRGGDKPHIQKAIANQANTWWIENASAIKAWVNLHQQGNLSHEEFLARLRDNMLHFEIRNNAIRQSLTTKRNQERKALNAEAQSDLVVSTVHGAKGLEFDNVVVLYKEDNGMSEATKRMFYVAFTRAMNSELITSYGTLANPALTSNHEAITNALIAQEKVRAARAAGLDPDLVEDEEDAEEKQPASI